jgi:hypothetical protein
MNTMAPSATGGFLSAFSCAELPDISVGTILEDESCGPNDGLVPNIRGRTKKLIMIALASATDRLQGIADFKICINPP